MPKYQNAGAKKQSMLQEKLERKMKHIKLISHWADYKVYGGIAGFKIPQDVIEEAKKSGYLNAFQVYQSGETVLLLSNKKIKSNENIIYPNPKLYEGIEAIIPKNQDKTKDLTIVALCKDKKDFSLFDKIDINIKNSSLLFGELLDIIDDCKISTKILTIK